MQMSTESIVMESVSLRCDLSWLHRAFVIAAFLVYALLLVSAVNGQTSLPTPQESPTIVEGVNDTMVYSIGRSLQVNGNARNGALVLGGDLIVQGTVDGDVAAVGGSVIQLQGARISGDVMVIGGSYSHVDEVPLRSPTGQTIMFAGYEAELRTVIRNPQDLLSPHWTARSIGLRILAILFWFVVSLALTAAMPGTISRGVARLQLTSLRVAVIGVLGAVAIGPGAILALRYLPTPISAVVGMMALLLVLIAGLFGRVMIYAATGRWIQRHFLRNSTNSEVVALLLGTTTWILFSSIPYVWPFVVTVIWVLSLGLALTARYRVGWKRTVPV